MGDRDGWADHHAEEYVALVEAALLGRDVRPASAPAYEYVGAPLSLGLVQRCTDCGALLAIADTEAHDRFHAILNDHARGLAVLVNSHLAAHVLDRFDVRERLGDG